MNSDAYLTHLGRELDTFEAMLDGDLSVPVTGCGDWTLYDLVDHVGRGNIWAAVAVTECRGDHREAAPAPHDPPRVAAWFRHTSAVLLNALRADPSTPAWTFYPPHTVGFWRRRRCLETLIHRWDAGQALGIAAELDPALADEGIAEVFDTMAPFQIGRGHAKVPRQAIRLVATDTDTSWVFGPGDPVATVGATAAELVLMLWGRLSPGADGMRWDGDRAAGQVVLDGPLVP